MSLDDEGGKEYDSFDADVYLKDFCGPGKIELYASLPYFVELFSQFADASVRVLDFGGGPSFMPLIIAARKASLYVHADYAKNNRTAVERWWKKEAGSFDWRENVRYVLKLEGNNDATDEEVAEREELMRKVLGGVVYCDILADQTMPPGFRGPFDVVTCLSCLDCACTSADSLREAIGKLSRLVSDGGYLIIQCSTTRADHSISDEEQKRLNNAYGETVHSTAGYVNEAKDIGGFKYSGFLYEGITTYVKFLELNGFTVVRQLEYIYDDPSIHYTDNIGILIGKKAK